MIALLAQLPEPHAAQSIGWLALAAFSLAGGINQVMAIMDRFKEKPVPADTYATKTDHAKLAADHAKLEVRVAAMDTKIEENFRALDHKRSVSIAGLHKAIDEKTTALRVELKEEHRGVQNRLTDVIGKIGELKGVVR